MLQHGLGRHIGYLSTEHVVNIARIRHMAEIPLIISTIFSRVSVCLFLLRPFTVYTRWRWTLYFITTLTTVTNIALASSGPLRCQPQAKLWDPTLPGMCWQPGIMSTVVYFQGGELTFTEQSSGSRANWHPSCLSVLRLSPLGLPHILSLEDTNEYKGQSRSLWYHVSRSTVTLAGTFPMAVRY